MASKKKLLQAAAGAAGAEALDVDDVFSTFLYTGTGGNATITNGIDLSGKGGLVITKRRNVSYNWGWFDTERGAARSLHSNDSDAEEYLYNGGALNGVRAFNSDGFNIGDQAIVNSYTTTDTIASWTFRKAPKFFDVVTYTGNSVAGRAINHNLNGTVGMLIIKRTDGSGNWFVLDVGTGKRGYIDYTAAAFSTASGLFFGDGSSYQAPTSTQFFLSSNSNVNQNGYTYVAYLFAHNNNDGGFGPDSDQDIIKCGSYTGTGAKLDINLGFEAQWVMVKRTDASGYDWHMFDVMRGMPVGSDASWLEANTSNPEANNAYMSAHPTGFTLPAGHPEVCANGGNYIYMAIRRGPLAAPEDATDVFAIDVRDDTDAPMYKSGFVTDFSLYRDKAGNDDWRAQSRLTGKGTLFPNVTASESSIYNNTTWDFMNGFKEAGSINTGYLSWMWKRAPEYFDVVAYVGNDTAGRTVSHNLGAVPEMMWVKRRNSTGGDWEVYHKDIGNTKYLILNSTAAASTNQYRWNNTTPTESVFTIGTATNVNANGDNFIAYLFATVAGISKVGSFSHTNGGGDTNVDCGFSSGARLVIYKRTDDTGSWYIFDSVRGIVSGSGDAQLELNSTGAENTGFDLIDPYSSGFKIPSNAIGTGDYIFYAIA